MDEMETQKMHVFGRRVWDCLSSGPYKFVVSMFVT